MKKFRAILVAAVLLLTLFSIPASAHGTGKSYVYNHNGQAQEIPDPYYVNTTIGYDLGMAKPVDMVIRNEKLYILDTGHEGGEYSTRLLVLDNSYNKVDEILFFNKNGTPFTFSEPRGLWIDEKNTIYITDRSAHMLYMFDMEGMPINAIGKPNHAMIDQEAEYLPTAVLTDHLGYIYVRVENDYRGFMLMEQSGKFLGYFGANDVTRTAEVIMRQVFSWFYSEDQMEIGKQSLPMEYSNFCIDPSGSFIYGVRGTTEDMNELIRKINCKSKNVLDYKGSFGDIGLSRVGGQNLATNFNAITVDELGFITVADATWQRLFQYTPEGQLMYVFGGKGSQEGTFTDIADIESWGDRLLVLDEVYATISVMKPSTFGANIRLGETYYSQGDYESSLAPFEEVIAECMNYEFGYSGIGKAMYMQGNYEEAMHYFYLAHNQDDYSMAYKMHRGTMIAEAIVPVVIVIGVLILLIVVREVLKRKGVIKAEKVPLDEGGKGRYLLYTILHPIDGYQEMRYNKKHSFLFANVAIFFFFFSAVIMSLYSGFIFNGTTADTYNMVFTICGVLGGFSLFVLVNWLMSTFFEGKGKLKEVWTYLGYATIPYSVTCFLYTLMSNFFTLEEKTFLDYLMMVGMGWSIVMVFFALQGLHMYSFKRNVISIVVTILGMLVVIFIVFLMFNLFVQFFSFVESIYKEVLYRMAVGF